MQKAKLISGKAKPKRAKNCLRAGTRNQASASTTNADLLRNAPSVPKKSGKQSADYAAGFEASYKLYKSGDLAELKAKASAYDTAKRLILEQERATQRVGKIEKQLLGLFNVPVKAYDGHDDDDDDSGNMARLGVR